MIVEYPSKAAKIKGEKPTLPAALLESPIWRRSGTGA
jgi:hypothetical protein